LSVKKLRVGVIYGGRSGEHEVSVASAAAVFKNLPRSRYEPVAIRIDKDGRWSLPDRPPTALAASEVIEQSRVAIAHPVRPGREAHLVAYPAEETILTIDRRKAAKGEPEESARVTGLGLDVVFPVLHGPHGEDGTVQGLLELSNVPYVGAGVLASAVGMDKAFMKVAFAARALPIAEYRTVLFGDWTTNRDALIASIEALGYPVFVKPANLGSSVGISKAKTRQDLVTAVDLAFEYDRKVVVEAAVPAARELEVGVLGNDAPEASVAGEIIPGREFYDYEAKYLDGGSTTRVPADLDPAMHAEVKRLAIEAFQAIDCSGMARVDFLLSKETGRLYVNEINTIPGFTTISMYSQLWAASGVDYPALLDRLIKLAIERHAEKQRLKTSAS
jgi:D-alanine-D-alanine ligase